MKILSNLVIAFAVVSAVAMCSCSSEEPAVKDTPRAEIKLSRSQQAYVDSESRFAFDFFKAVNQKEIASTNSNIVISPLSMARDLSMLACGATDETLESIMRMLHIGDGGSVDELNELNRTLLDALLNADNQVALTVANSFWYSNAFTVKESYLNTIRADYNAESKEVDFKNASTEETINNWCKIATKGVIQNIFNQLESSDYIRFMLLDATYFHGDWSKKFPEENTKSQTFYNNGVTETKVATMSRTGNCAVGGDDKTTVLQLNYGNEAYSMYFVMADEGNDINDIISDLNLDKWNDLKNSMHVNEYKIFIPKFNISYKPDLTKIMEDMGMTTASPKLPNMSNQYIDILEIKQKAAITVDESGTEAAGVSTITGMEYLPGIKGEIHINRPFMFLIEEYSTGAILFAGKIVEL
ncbi:MAG: serpin family protein [Bacteroides sp.]|nr:serpin family protein [Bacteroides sp.]